MSIQLKNKPFLAEVTLESLKEYLKGVGEASFRAKQIIDWIFKKDIINPDENVGKKSLDNFKSTLSSEEVGGAVVFGVDGIIVKAHGTVQ